MAGSLDTLSLKNAQEIKSKDKSLGSRQNNAVVSDPKFKNKACLKKNNEA